MLERAKRNSKFESSYTGEILPPLPNTYEFRPSHITVSPIPLSKLTSIALYADRRILTVLFRNWSAFCSRKETKSYVTQKNSRV